MDQEVLDRLSNNLADAFASGDADSIVNAFTAIVDADVADGWTSDYRTRVAIALGQRDGALGLKFLGSWMNEPTLRFLNEYCLQNFDQELGYPD